MRAPSSLRNPNRNFHPLIPQYMIPMRVASRLFLAALAFLLMHAAPLHADNAIRIEDPWVRAAPASAMAQGGFLVMENTTNVDIHLIEATSSQFGRVELHRTEEVEGLMRMVKQERIAIPANGRTVLKPGDYHIMLIEPKEHLQPGDAVSVILTFDHAPAQTIEMPVRDMRGGNHGRHHHGNMHNGHHHKHQGHQH